MPLTECTCSAVTSVLSFSNTLVCMGTAVPPTPDGFAPESGCVLWRWLETSLPRVEEEAISRITRNVKSCHNS
eukprot:m.352987 g.352987  ORF g.352987 m.352987 type:complete len:73 (-) comp16587_c0_seq1:234-452(-)